MRRHFIPRLLLMIALLVAMAACGAGTTSGAATSVPGTTAPTNSGDSGATSPAQLGNATIHFLSGQAEDQGYTKVIGDPSKEFSAQNPSVVYEYEQTPQTDLDQKIVQLASSDSLPILFPSPAAGTLVEMYDNGLVADTEQVFKEQGLPPMLDYDIRHGRTYLYFADEPLYPFGYGLSYTSFSYSNLQLSDDRLGAEETLEVRVDVANSGERAGDEVVQLYVKHLDSAVERPLQELKGFRRVHLEPGEISTVTIPLAARDLAYWSVAEQRFVVEHDTISIRIGRSSTDIQLEATIEVAP